MGQISMIFGGNMSIASKTQEKKLEREITLAQRIEPGTKMKWFDIDISFGAEDHPETELSERILPFMVKLPVGWHKVAKTLIDNEASLNLIMRKTFIEMRLNLKDLTPVHDTFHGVIPGQSTTPIRWINLKVWCGTEDNKRKEMLRFEVDSFDIGYNCILGRPFLLKFMSIIHTIYATMKMSGPKGVITIKADQQDALGCENATLTHVGRCGKKVAQEQAAKVVKTKGGSTSLRSPVPKPPIIGIPLPHSVTKGTCVASTSTQQPVDQPVDDKKKGADNKEILADSSNPDKMLRISTCLNAK
jgi:hypothetical protein